MVSLWHFLIAPPAGASRERRSREMRNTWVRSMRAAHLELRHPPYRISSAVLRRRNHARHLGLNSAPCPADPTREEFAMRDTWT